QTRKHPALMVLFLVITTNFASNWSVFGENRAPPAPDKPWSSPQLYEYEAELAREGRSQRGPSIEIDPQKVYDLPELIDIAERVNPQTRIAWERARQAMSTSGLSQSIYFPYLAASASAGYERAFIPFPTLKQGPSPAEVSITGGGTLVTD